MEFKDSQRLRRGQLRLLYLQDIQDPLVHNYCKQSDPSNSCKIVTKIVLLERIFSLSKEDVLFASGKIISAEIVNQRINVSSVRVDIISAFAHLMVLMKVVPTIVPIFQEHRVKNSLRISAGTMMKVPLELHPDRNRTRNNQRPQSRTSQPCMSVPLLQSCFKRPKH